MILAGHTTVSIQRSTFNPADIFLNSPQKSEVIRRCMQYQEGHPGWPLRSTQLRNDWTTGALSGKPEALTARLEKAGSMTDRCYCHLSQIYSKMVAIRDGEITRWSRVFAALAEVLGSPPGTHIRRFKDRKWGGRGRVMITLSLRPV